MHEEPAVDRLVRLPMPSDGWITPKVGRIVHIIGGEDDGPLAAIVTKVWDSSATGCINLTLFGPAGDTQPLTSIRHVSTGDALAWAWPTLE